MDRRVIFAVAGSGKTTFLISQLDTERRFLLVTYTINNAQHLRDEIIRKFGYFPPKIVVYTFFEFLINFCYSPFYKDSMHAKGIWWDQIPESARFFNNNQRKYYLSESGLLYHNRISRLCERKSEDIKHRIEKYFDCFFLDEVQDVAGHDFNFLLKIIPSSGDVLFVGDFFQHTFDTSLDGNVNSSLHDDYSKYQQKWANCRLDVDTTSFRKSHRCSKAVCEYVKNSTGIDIESNREEEGQVVYVDSDTIAKSIIVDNNTPKFFLQESYSYRCRGINWGESKGMDDFNDICVVLNKKTLDLYKKGKLPELPQRTKNKFYVACTRAKGILYLLPYTYLSQYKIKKSLK